MIAFIGYATIAGAFLWVCWQVAGAYAEYQERGEVLEDQSELIDSLSREVHDLQQANTLLAADNREQRREIYQTRHINKQLRQEVKDVSAATEPSKN